MIEQLILGAIQGITEWLPVSSEAVLVLIHENILGGGSLETILKGALLLHFGTLLAALVYFWNDIKRLCHTLFHAHESSSHDRKVLRFLIISTLISGGMGIIFLGLIDMIEPALASSGVAVTLVIGILLIITGVLQLSAEKTQSKRTEVTTSDSVLLGIIQGFAVLPGFSRSGLTVSTLLLRGYDKATSLQLSFLMSIPIVLAGNIVLNINGALITTASVLGLVASFVFGLLTIKGLMKLAEKVNFGYFVIIFGVLAIIAGLL